MLRIRRSVGPARKLAGRAVAAGLTGAVLLLVGGCGGLPTVVPAGSAGMEVPPDSAASAGSGADRAPVAAGRASAAVAPRAAAPTTVAPPVPKPGLTAAAVASGTGTGSAKAGAARKAGSPIDAAAAGRGTGATRTPAVSASKAAAPGGTAASARAAALPAAGTYTYALTGTSSLGPPPRTSTMTVADAGGGTQLWTLDSRREDGAGMVEELTLGHQEAGLNGAGVYMSAYRLDASTGIAGVILEFNPSSPVLLTPTAGKAGTTWPFDLGTSADGCATAKGTGEILDPVGATAPSTRRFRLTTTVITVGPALCVALEGERTQEIWHPADTLLPNRIDSDMRGRVAGAPFTATTKATRTQGSASGSASGRAQAPHPAVAADRVRP